LNALLEKPLLPAFVHGVEPESDDASFKIDDEKKAAWAAGKILSARRRIATRCRLAEEYQNRILDWLTGANEHDQQSLNFLEGSLRPWVEEAVSHLGKTRSLRLPGSKVGLRKKPDRVEIINLELALAFCEENDLDEVVIVKKELSKTELKTHLSAGARIPGAELVPGSDELTVSED
jgi:phage host-nuclease inhibitor protein Gam